MIVIFINTDLFLGAYAKLQNATVRFVISVAFQSVCLSVRREKHGSHRKIFMKLVFFENMSRTFNFF